MNGKFPVRQRPLCRHQAAAAAGRVVAIAEFYENATALSHEMTLAKRDAWLITGIVFVGMMGSMLVIVTRGSRLIERQRRAMG